MSQQEREMPHSDDAERSMLGAILIDNNVIVETLSLVQPDDLYRASHRYIYQAMIDINTRADSIDVISLVNQLEAKSLLEEAGGRTFVTSLSNTVPSALNADTYASIIKRCATLRRLIAASDSIIQDSYKGVSDFAQFIDNVEQRVFAITQEGFRPAYTPIRKVVNEAFTHIEKLRQVHEEITGVPSGFVDLDRVTGGWQSSDLIILAARPSMGKTSLTLNMLAHAAIKSNIPAAFFSLEMSNLQLAIRLLSAESLVDQSHMRSGSLSEPEWLRLVNAVGVYSRAPIFLDDTPALPIMSFRSRARRLVKEHNVGIIFVDYLQLMKGTSKVASSGSREQEISEISRNLKAVAKDLNIPIIALAQLNRGVDSRADKRPMMSDLRESGAIEQDADIIMFIYREFVYSKKLEDKNVAELIIGKHRNGALTTIELLFDGEHTRFANLARDPVGGVPAHM